jgi:CMP-N-acetylneuraminic acid synthetase
MSAETQLKKTFNTCVDLDATSPLRLVSDIVGSVELLESQALTNVITGAPAHRSPYFNLVEENEHGYVALSKKFSKPIERRQSAPKCYNMNASIYVWQREALLNNDSIFLATTKIFEMPPERSLDIDSELDFEIVEFIAKKQNRFQQTW